MAVAAPQKFGRYVLHERIGVGGMAEVFRATYRTGSFEKTLVIKRILSHLADDEEFVEMFREEAAISSALSHANVVQVFDFGLEDQCYFLAMEYVEGKNLRQLLQRCKEMAQPALPIPFALYMMEEVAKGLAHAHTRKDPVIHRDVSPANILISGEGNVKIADFGIARASSRMGTTREGIVRGKISYLAPEQLTARKADERVDLWALGAVFWEALTGARLVRGDTNEEIVARILSGAIRNKPSEVRSSIPAEVDHVVESLLQADPDRRYGSAAALLAELRPLVAKSGISATEAAEFLRRIFPPERAEDLTRSVTINVAKTPGPPTALLVHPVRRIRQLVGDALRDRKLTVVEAGTIQDAEDVARAFSPFAVLIAPELLAQDCSRLYERLGERALAPVRVIVLTHEPTDTQIDIAFQRGMSFLLKPVDDGERLADVLAVFAAAPNGGAPEEPGTPGVRQVGTPAILVVDDSATVRLAVSALLVSQGYRVFVASDAATALRFLREKDSAVDLVISDLNMEGMDGFELKYEIDRLRTHPLPFILVTAEATEDTRGLARRVGTSGFISKPVEPDILLDTVARVLRASGVRIPGAVNG